MLANEIISSDNKSRFVEILYKVQSEMDTLSVDYRIIGSIATVAQLEQANPGSVSLDFNRQNACTLDQRVPDIDLFVPRKDITAIHELREKYLKSDFPIKIGAAAGVNHIDFRPDSEVSYLTHRQKLQRPIPTALLEPLIIPFLDTTIKTVVPSTLFHTYQTFGGIIRQKDISRLRALRSSYPDPQKKYPEKFYRPFHDFIKDRARSYPYFTTLARTKDFAERKLPGKVYNRVIQEVLMGIDVLHLPLR